MCIYFYVLLVFLLLPMGDGQKFILRDIYDNSIRVKILTCKLDSYILVWGYEVPITKVQLIL